MAKEFDITRERINQIWGKAIKKLRHPSRARKLKVYLFDVFSVTYDNSYSELLTHIFGDIDPSLKVEVKLGIDSNIVDKEKNSVRSVSEIKSELNRNIADIESLQPFLEHLQRININTLDHLLHTSNTKILFDAFERNDLLYFNLLKVLSSMGYNIKGNKKVSQFDLMFIEELKSAGINTSIYDQMLEELPLGVTLILFENNITTIGELLNNIAKIKQFESLSDEMKRQIDDFLINKQLLITYEDKTVYTTEVFWNIYLKTLICWLRDNEYSIFSLKKELEKSNCKSNGSIIQVVKNLYPDFCLNSYTDVLTWSIEELDLSVRTINCLRHSTCIETVGDIVTRTVEDMIKIRNLGKKSLEEILEKLALYGLSLANE